MEDKGNPFILFDNLAQAYHWPHSEIKKLTWPQIILYNHAAWYNREYSDRKYKAKNGDDSEPSRPSKTSPFVEDPKIPQFGNKKLSEIAKDDKSMDLYMMQTIQDLSTF